MLITLLTAFNSIDVSIHERRHLSLPLSLHLRTSLQAVARLPHRAQSHRLLDLRLDLHLLTVDGHQWCLQLKVKLPKMLRHLAHPLASWHLSLLYLLHLRTVVYVRIGIQIENDRFIWIIGSSS